MQGRPFLLVCACIAIAWSGCVEKTPAVEESTAEVPPVAPGPVSWKESLEGSVVYRLTVDGDPKTTCKLSTETRPAEGTSGWASFVLEQTNGKVSSWMLQGASMQEARVQVYGTIDSAAVLPATWWEEPLVVEWPVEGFAGAVTLTFGARGLVADGTPNFSIRFSCNGAHTILELEGGRDLSIFDAQSSHSGVTAGVRNLLAPTAAARSQMLHESNAPTVRFMFACSYFFARAELTTPDGSVPIACDPNPAGEARYYEKTSGPGSFVLDHNEVDPFDGGSWAVLYGLYPIAALSDVLDLPEGHGHGCESLC